MEEILSLQDENEKKSNVDDDLNVIFENNSDSKILCENKVSDFIRNEDEIKKEDRRIVKFEIDSNYLVETVKEDIKLNPIDDESKIFTEKEEDPVHYRIYGDIHKQR